MGCAKYFDRIRFILDSMFVLCVFVASSCFILQKSEEQAHAMLNLDCSTSSAMVTPKANLAVVIVSHADEITISPLQLPFFCPLYPGSKDESFCSSLPSIEGHSREELLGEVDTS